VPLCYRYRLTEMLSGFVRSRPGLRLDVRCGLSVHLRQALERGELDLALFKLDLGETGGVASWPERLHWIASRRYPIDFRRDPLPLAVFEQGCLYRNRAIHALEAAGRAWHIAYSSPNLPGIQAAVSAGLGVSILPEVAILPDHCLLDASDGFPPITDTEVALVTAPEAHPAVPPTQFAQPRRYLGPRPRRATLQQRCGVQCTGNGMAKKKITDYGGRWKPLRTLTEGGQAQIFLVQDKTGAYAEPCVLKRVLTPRAGRPLSRRGGSGQDPFAPQCREAA
jgi:hypothetical protein